MKYDENNPLSDISRPSEGEFDLLVQKYLDGTLEPKDAARFKACLSDPQYVACFVEKCKQDQLMYELIAAGSCQPDDTSDSFDLSMWQEFGKYEACAPAVVRSDEPVAERELIQKVEHPKIRRKINRSSIISLCIAAAAVLFMITFVHVAPISSNIQVATLTDSIGARWADRDVSMQKGARLRARNTSLLLREGLAQIQFDNNAQITIEGPAEFQILGEDMVRLNYGQIYSIVPPEAYGFQICTRDSKIIDLGTEFGVKQDLDGDMEVHVLRGKVVFVSKAVGKNNNIDMIAGSARRLNAITGDIGEIACREDLFVRQIDSASDLIWRGQALNLADVVGGGNGFSGGIIESGIDPSSGAVYLKPRQDYTTVQSDTYNTVQNRPFIDGVFVPDGRYGANQITSAGHTFSGFPSTSGKFYSDITANPYVIEIQGKEADSTPKKKVVSKLTPVSQNAEIMKQPCIFIHTNAGITFDLQQIRQAHPSLDITTFTARCESPSVWARKAEFWVLLDGECVFQCTADDARLKKQVVQVPIRPDHGYLTLVTTDGQDGQDYDWCLFSRPEIWFAPRVHTAEAGL